MSAAIRAALFVSVAVGAAVAVVGACLPDPPALPGDDAGDGSPIVTTAAGCGDGVVATLDDGGDAGEQCDPGNDPNVLGCTQECTISCGGIIGPSGHCYFLADPTLDYHTAIFSCGGATAHVVTIDSDEESLLVRSLVGPNAVYRIGLAGDFVAEGFKTPNPPEEPGWPLADNHCPGCYARGTDDAGLFPLREDAGSGCLVAGPDDRWTQVPCIEDAGVGYKLVCEREPAGQRSTACGGPLCTTLAATAGKKRYVISLGASTADEAAKFCAGFDGGSLVTITSNQEREQLARELRLLLPSERGSGVIEVWTGLTKVGSDWKWDDGSDASIPWAENEPSPSDDGRAFMRLDVNAFDTQLVKTELDGGGAQRIFVCERAP